jgi:hypothetical protein
MLSSFPTFRSHFIKSTFSSTSIRRLSEAIGNTFKLRASRTAKIRDQTFYRLTNRASLSNMRFPNSMRCSRLHVVVCSGLCDQSFISAFSLTLSAKICDATKDQNLSFDRRWKCFGPRSVPNQSPSLLLALSRF